MAGKKTAEFKARVALETLRERDSVQAIAARHELHPNQVSIWRSRPKVTSGPRSGIMSSTIRS